MRAVLKLLSLGAWPPVRAAQPPRGRPAPRRVWRITAEHPSGAWIDPDAAPPAPAAATGPLPLDSWTTSTMDLLDGVQVVELDDTPAGETKPH